MTLASASAVIKHGSAADSRARHRKRATAALVGIAVGALTGVGASKMSGSALTGLGVAVASAGTILGWGMESTRVRRDAAADRVSAGVGALGGWDAIDSRAFQVRTSSQQSATDTEMRLQYLAYEDHQMSLEQVQAAWRLVGDGFEGSVTELVNAARQD